MLICPVYAREGWFCDRFANEWIVNNKKGSTKNLFEADVIWVVSPWLWNQIPPMLLLQKKVVTTIHHIVPEKFNEKEFAARDHYTNLYHVPCEKTKSFVSKHTDKPVKVVGYWINSHLWFAEDKKELRRVYAIPDDKYVVGSFQRDTEGHDLKSPKLEKGPDLFCDYVERLNEEKEVLVLLNGWRRQYVQTRLKKAGMRFMYRELPPINVVRHMYNMCDLYVVAARVEGGPQAVLEAPAMKVPIISTDVGMASSVLPESCIVDVENEIYYPTEEDVNEAYKNVQKYDIKTHMDEYTKMFKEVLEV